MISDMATYRMGALVEGSHHPGETYETFSLVTEHHQNSPHGSLKNEAIPHLNPSRRVQVQKRTAGYSDIPSFHGVIQAYCTMIPIPTQSIVLGEFNMPHHPSPESLWSHAHGSYGAQGTVHSTSKPEPHHSYQ